MHKKQQDAKFVLENQQKSSMGIKMKQAITNKAISQIKNAHQEKKGGFNYQGKLLSMLRSKPILYGLTEMLMPLPVTQ